MPVIIKPSPELVGRNTDPTVHSAEGLLKNTSKAWSPAYEKFNTTTFKMEGPEKRWIVQSSF